MHKPVKLISRTMDHSLSCPAWNCSEIQDSIVPTFFLTISAYCLLFHTGVCVCMSSTQRIYSNKWEITDPEWQTGNHKGERGHGLLKSICQAHPRVWVVGGLPWHNSHKISSVPIQQISSWNLLVDKAKIIGKELIILKNALTYLTTEQVDPAAADTPVGWELSQGYL